MKTLSRYSWLRFAAAILMSTQAGASAASQEKMEGVMVLTSPAFSEGDPIPKEYSGEGRDESPPLIVSDAPKGTMELVLICDDPDAPRPQPWVHWVLYGLYPATSSIPRGMAQTASPNDPKGATQGENSWGRTGYNGPLPPPGSGWHRYHFHLYAIDTRLDLKPGAAKEAVLEAIRGHILAEANLMGKYRR